jgi:hypothetical protein
MEGIYVRLRASIEAEVQVRGRRLPSNNVDVREARLAVSLVELRYTEGSENDLVEADAFTVVARMYIKVINDRASPVPFSAVTVGGCQIQLPRGSYVAWASVLSPERPLVGAVPHAVTARTGFVRSGP